MNALKHISNAFVTLYGDTSSNHIQKALATRLKNHDIKILTPESPEFFEQAAQNSVLVFIGIKDENDPNIKCAEILRKNDLIVGRIIAVNTNPSNKNKYFECNIHLLSKGYDNAINLDDLEKPEFNTVLIRKIQYGQQRLQKKIQEEEFRRFSDALAVSPVSMLIFDADKRIVFVSDHYLRAYPKIAARLVRGLRSYDAFELMIAEEKIDEDDPRYDKIRNFMITLSGEIDFVLDDGMHYRVRAIQLPNNRGTVMTAQNITGYTYRKNAHESR